MNQDKRWFISWNILNALRNFVEWIIEKVSWITEYDFYKLKDAKKITWDKSKYKFLYDFHKYLQISTSHYSQNEINNERLMLKYIENLIEIKNFMKKEYNMELLENIYDFPLEIDSVSQEYYEKISKIIDDKQYILNANFNDSYYIWNIKPFFVNKKIYYEITFSLSVDNSSKFDRFTAFTDIKILPNYAVKFKISNSDIEFFGTKIPINIIQDYEISIRPCEFKNFLKLFDENVNVNKTKEYFEIMSFMKMYKFNLNDIVNFSDETFLRFKEHIIEKSNTSNIIIFLEKCRGIVKNKKSWENIIRYLLYRMNNKIIKNLYNFDKNNLLSDLKISNKAIPFDEMPVCTSLPWHNLMLEDIINCIDIENRKEEFLSKIVSNNTEIEWILYTDIETLKDFDNLNNLIFKFNSKLYESKEQQWRKLELYNKFIFRKSYENDIKNIIENLKVLSNQSFSSKKIIWDWILENADKIDDDNKKKILENIFDNSKLALIYWAAWTWKTKLLEYLSDIFGKNSKLLLANTNTAVDNLKRRVNHKNSSFSTIEKYLNTRNLENYNNYNIIIIDECSTVKNSDFLKILERKNFDLLVLVWDIYQIESINFWNWFSIAKKIIKNWNFELEKTHRLKEWDKNSENLLNLWMSVRNLNNNIVERINQYSKIIDNSIFEKYDQDEIILCLNYNWLYWINNINRFLQENNKNKSFVWENKTYKVWDPVLFNETKYFDILHNNLKWVILDIELSEDKIFFSIEVEKIIDDRDIMFDKNIELLGEANDGKTKIRFSVEKIKSTDDDEIQNIVVPFQVSYAISIHKSQWLEYNSVKIIISDEIDEIITHNILYTAITRTKKNLNIYWNPETSNKIIKNLKLKNINKDFNILKNKFGL